MCIRDRETAIPVIMSLVERGILDMNTMIEKMTVGPAMVLGIDRGHLQEGAVADVTIIDPQAVRRVDPASFYSKGRNNPYKEREYTGWPYATIVAGKVVAREGIIV